MSQLNSTRTKYLLWAGLFMMITWPVWRWLWGEWWGNDYYSHGVLIVPIALYLAWRRWQRAEAAPGEAQTGDSRGLWLVAASIAAYIVALEMNAFYLAAYAMIALLVGMVWTFGGMRWVQAWLFPLAFLLLMVPIPFIDTVTLPLALLTGVCSGAVVQFLGMDVAVVGNSVQLPNTELLIGAQCSGINSMIASVALLALVAYALHGPMWGRVLLVFTAVPLAMAGNILRVASLIGIALFAGVESAFTFYHDYSGILAFLLILAAAVPISRGLQCRSLRYDLL